MSFATVVEKKNFPTAREIILWIRNNSIVSLYICIGIIFRIRLWKTSLHKNYIFGIHWISFNRAICWHSEVLNMQILVNGIYLKKPFYFSMHHWICVIEWMKQNGIEIENIWFHLFREKGACGCFRCLLRSYVMWCVIRNYSWMKSMFIQSMSSNVFQM